MRRLLMVAAGALATALGGCWDGAGLDRLAAGERGRVSAVRSGDVVVLDSGLVVRLAGIEAPRGDEPGADAALADLRRRAEGREIALFYGGARRDAYGRALAQARLTAGRRWLQCDLLRDGAARVRTFADNTALAHELLECEAAGRRRGRGVWALRDYRVLVPQEVGRDVSGFQIVEGRIARVTPAWDGDTVEVDGARDGFAVRIDGRALPRLRRAGMAPAALTGRLARVRGVIGRDGVMRLDHPEQIELLKDR